MLWVEAVGDRRSYALLARHFFAGRRNFLGRGDFAPSQDSQEAGETEGKFKLRQVCPRKLSHCRGAPSILRPFCAQVFVALLGFR